MSDIVNLKPKQVKWLEAVYFGRGVLALLPMGYGNLLFFHLLPALLFGKFSPSTLNSGKSNIDNLAAHFLGDT